MCGIWLFAVIVPGAYNSAINSDTDINTVAEENFDIESNDKVPLGTASPHNKPRGKTESFTVFCGRFSPQIPENGGFMRFVLSDSKGHIVKYPLSHYEPSN